jgi:uncharacterized protein YndB with AHSA1/START domain
MTTPDVPLRMELTFEVPGTPEQVWAAIATANGNTSWFMPTDLEEHEGGAVVFHMGEEASHGTITGWDPPHRLEYAEPGWAALAGHGDADVTPLVTEFLVEAQSGGTCVLRVVSSAFGTGADWENEFMAEMEKGWAPAFANLQLYLAHFPGQQVTPLTIEQVVPGDIDAVWSELRDAVGAHEPGDGVDVRGLSGRLARVSGPPDGAGLLVHVTDPLPGMLALYVYPRAEGEVSANLRAYLFSDEAQAYVAREEPAWRSWLTRVAVPS